MDKASIIGDSIVYVQELQQQVQNIEKEIAEMEENMSSNNRVAEDSGASGGSGASESKEHATGREISLDQVLEEGKLVIESDNTVTATSSLSVDPQDPSPGYSPLVEKPILNVSQYASELLYCSHSLFHRARVTVHGCSSSMLVFSRLATPLRSISVFYRWRSPNWKRKSTSWRPPAKED